MSFNIRCDVARDGENRWEKRKALLVDVIRQNDPDVLGTQEVLANQRDYLDAALEGYARVGTGREDNDRQGEAAAIYFKRDRYDLIDNGQSWLSETPTKVNSMGWDAVCTRIITWAVLCDRRDGSLLVLGNTHFDHEGEIARVESAKLVRRLLREIAAKHKTDAVLLTGDFNCVEGSPAYLTLTAKNESPRLFDAHRIVHPVVEKDEVSFNGFTGERIGLRIDWILNSAAWTPTNAIIDRSSRDARYPSDHYPVVVDFSR